MREKTMQKARELFDAKIQFVSLVDAAANKRKFLLAKARDGTGSFESCGRILKADPEAHYVTGIVYEPMTEDTDGEFMTAEEIRKAAYYYVKNFENVDIQHSFEKDSGCAVVESWIAKADFSLGGETVREGTWLMTVEVKDNVLWEKIEKGEITGFSMGGICRTSGEDVDLSTMGKTENVEEKKGLLKKLACFLGLSPVEKGGMSEAYAEQVKEESFDRAIALLGSSLRRYDYMSDAFIYETDEGKIRAAVEDFQTIITELLAGKEPDRTPETEAEKEETEVTKEEMTQIIEAAVEKAMKSGQEVSSAMAEDTAGAQKAAPQAMEKAADAADVGKAIDELPGLVEKAVKEALEAQQEAMGKLVEEQVEKAMEPVLKANHLPSNLNHETVSVEAVEDHYLHGIL